MAKVSICVPTYNNPDDLKRLMESIEKQTYKDYEVVISDDSTDNNIEKLIAELKHNECFVQKITYFNCKSACILSQCLRVNASK